MRGAHLYIDFKDPKVMATGIEALGVNSAWKELGKAEEHLRQNTLMGIVAIGHTRLCYFLRTQIHKAWKKQMESNPGRCLC